MEGKLMVRRLYMVCCLAAAILRMAGAQVLMMVRKAHFLLVCMRVKKWVGHLVGLVVDYF
jgi:hypothetical protein